MRIGISGASGFIGKQLSTYFQEKGYEIVSLDRTIIHDSEKLTDALLGCQAVINLAGANISHPWTSKYKKELYDSRIEVTRKLVNALNSLPVKPDVFISTSAVGYYPDHGFYDEYSMQKGQGFLPHLCEDWENEASKITKETRLVIARLGIVLSPYGGAFPKMFSTLKFKIAAVVGTGQQMFPWIDIRDLVRAMEYIIQTSSMKGVVNFVAPQQLTQYQLAERVAHHYKCLLKVTIPKFFFRYKFGEASEFLLKGQSVIPTRLIKSDFTYLSPTIDTFLATPDKSTVDKVDLNRYIGKWYEIARYDHRFERNLIHVTAEYSFQSDGTIKVENKGIDSFSGKEKQVIGKAVSYSQDPGKLKVSFFPGISAKYFILELDQENYSYALIGSSSNKYLWILSRAPHLPDKVKHHLLECAEQKGYDISQLIWVNQS